MPRLLLHLFAGLLAVVLSAASPAGAQEVTARLVAERSALVPGETAWLGVHFEVEPGWFVYWRNPGESGAPPQVEWSLPDGLEPAGELSWPAPRRHVLQGGILDYIYEGRVTLLLPVRVAADLQPGARLEVRASLFWLVCREVCQMGEAEVALELPVAAIAGPSPEAPLFAAARERLPRPAPAGRVATSWEGTTLSLTVAGADALTWYPLVPAAPAPLDMVERGAGAGPRLTISYPATLAGVEVVAGVLEVRRGDAVAFYTVESRGPARDAAD